MFSGGRERVHWEQMGKEPAEESVKLMYLKIS